MKTLKRDNWTTKEVIKILEGCMIVTEDHKPSEAMAEYNMGVQETIETFQGFERPLDQMGAMAYDPQTDMIYHVGKIPER